MLQLRNRCLLCAVLGYLIDGFYNFLDVFLSQNFVSKTLNFYWALPKIDGLRNPLGTHRTLANGVYNGSIDDSLEKHINREMKYHHGSFIKYFDKVLAF